MDEATPIVDTDPLINGSRRKRRASSVASAADASLLVLQSALSCLFDVVVVVVTTGIYVSSCKTFYHTIAMAMVWH